MHGGAVEGPGRWTECITNIRKFVDEYRSAGAGRVQQPRRRFRIHHDIVALIQREEDARKVEDFQKQKERQPEIIRRREEQNKIITSYTNSDPQEEYTFNHSWELSKVTSRETNLRTVNDGGTFTVTQTKRELGKGTFGSVKVYRVTTTPLSLPAGWKTAVSRSTGQTYYANNSTGESTFDRPAGSIDGMKESFNLAGKMHHDKSEDATARYFLHSDRRYSEVLKSISNLEDLTDKDLEKLNAPGLNLHKYVARTTIVVNTPHLRGWGLVLSDLMTSGSLTKHIIIAPAFYSTERIIKVSRIIRGSIYSLIDGGYGYFDLKTDNIGVRLTGDTDEPYRWILIDAGSMDEICNCTYISLLAAFYIDDDDKCQLYQ